MYYYFLIYIYRKCFNTSLTSKIVKLRKVLLLLINIYIIFAQCVKYIQHITYTLNILFYVWYLYIYIYKVEKLQNLETYYYYYKSIQYVFFTRVIQIQLVLKNTPYIFFYTLYTSLLFNRVFFGAEYFCNLLFAFFFSPWYQGQGSFCLMSLASQQYYFREKLCKLWDVQYKQIKYYYYIWFANLTICLYKLDGAHCIYVIVGRILLLIAQKQMVFIINYYACIHFIINYNFQYQKDLKFVKCLCMIGNWENNKNNNTYNVQNQFYDEIGFSTYVWKKQIGIKCGGSLFMLFGFFLLFFKLKLVYYISVYILQNLVFFVSYVVVVLPILFYFIFFQLRHKYLNRTRLVEITITSSK
eukprot:TRINITY_DN24788_c0_g2_i1.p1 TRINITY_DN24788_c0_g2~~TRINITY_DN24788_c0_g2_i1.p1  ORF type:complete len:400 (-),score=-27.67 TRINITY_DN24788_c0_g2_i1:1-1068(-)